MMEKIDYPAAHSMDTEWFAMDEAGEVACFLSYETGPVPVNALVQSGRDDLFAHLDKDENGIPLLPALSDPFPDGYSTKELQQLFDALPETKRDAISQLASQTEGFEQSKRKYEESVSKLPYEHAVVLLTDIVDFEEFDKSSEILRLDPDKPLYYVGGCCLDAFCLLLKGRLLAWRSMEESYEFDLSQLHGIYLYNANDYAYTVEYLNKSIPLASKTPPQYERKKAPLQPRIGLPASVMQARLTDESGNALPGKRLIHMLPGVRFAEMASIQLADFIPVCQWRYEDLMPDSNRSIIRRNMAIAYQPASNERDAHIANWKSAAGQRDWLAQMSLAFLYSLGAHAQDSEMAFHWYWQAAQQVDEMPSAAKDMFENGSAAQCCVANLFERGVGVAQDYQQALHWYLKAVERQNYVAQYRLGLMYRDGRGVARDINQADLWRAKARQQGYGPD